MSARRMRSALIGAAAARLSYAALATAPPGGGSPWNRTNHRGEPVTLLEGPAVALGGIAGALAASGNQRERLAIAVAGAGAAAFGSYDDLAGNGVSKGFRGHLGALRAGELTTGAVKIAGIGATGLAAALIAAPWAGGGDAGGGRALGGHVGGGGAAGSGNRGHDGVRGAAAPIAVADTLINAGLVAGGANLLNLFDLRPGRAIKVALLAGGLLAPSRRGRAAAAAPLAAAAALLPEDLGERSMLGDAGANALGAMLGAAAASTLPRTARLGVLAVVVGLTAASEKVSFTKVIERTAPLRRLDMLGRRLVAPTVPAPSARAPAPDGTTPVAADPADADPADADPAAADPADGFPADGFPADGQPSGGDPAADRNPQADVGRSAQDPRSAEAR